METSKCDKCDKTFYLKWRLAKHKSIHQTKNVRFCHYFNNEKLCPFEEIGCMFLHAKSEICRFKKSCKNDLCQFRHDAIYHNVEQANNEENLRTNKSTLNVDNSDNSNNDLGAQKISNGLVDENVDDDSDSDVESYYCYSCNDTFRQEKDLKRHEQRHCTKCGQEFSPEKVLKKHKTICKGFD